MARSMRGVERGQSGAGDGRSRRRCRRRPATASSPARSTATARSTCVVTATGDDTTIARIIHLVERAQAQRAPSQAWVDRFAQRYTPVVLALAALVAIVPPLVDRRGVRRLGLPRARAARHRVSVRAGAVDADLDRFGAGGGGAARRARQGRRPSRAARGGSRGGARQDRDADPGRAHASTRVEPIDGATVADRARDRGGARRRAPGIRSIARLRRTRAQTGRSGPPAGAHPRASGARARGRTCIGEPRLLWARRGCWPIAG